MGISLGTKKGGRKNSYFEWPEKKGSLQLHRFLLYCVLPNVILIFPVQHNLFLFSSSETRNNRLCNVYS